MIKLSDNPTFTAEVELADGASISVQFRAINGKKLMRWLRDFGVGGESMFARMFWHMYALLVRRQRTSDKLHEVIESWDGVFGDDDQPIPYSKQALVQLLQSYPSAGSKLFNMFYQKRAEALLKN